MDVIVVIATHKKYQMPSDGMYLPVQAGAKGKDDIEDYQRDDDGSNISELNPYFCELTALYWVWKNRKADYIGMVHYRRHFSFHPYNKEKWNYILREEEIDNYLGKIKVFVPSKRRYYIETLYSHYSHTHYAMQLDETRNIIERKYPKFLRSFDKIMKQRWGYMFNMMIMEQQLFDDYCLWLFDILFELRDTIGKNDEKNLDTFQGRFYGRVSEIIFNVWLLEQLNNGKISRDEIKEIPVIHMDGVDWRKKGKAFLKAKFKGEKYSGSF